MSRGRPRLALAVPALIAAVGIIASVSLFAMLRANASSEAAATLAAAGEEIVRVASDVEAIAAQHALGIQGLMEASVLVTGHEFERFTEVIGHETSDLGFAPRVEADDIEEFEAQVRTERPDFVADFGDDTDVYWPLLFVNKEEGQAGYEVGFDLGSDPIIAAAIESAQIVGGPVASGFVSLPGDDRAGDMVVIAPVGLAEAPDGVALVTLQLDELLADRATQLTGEGVTLTLDEDVSQRAVATEDTWRATIPFAEHRFAVTLEREAHPANLLARDVATLLTGIALSVFLAFGISNLRRDHHLSRELNSLRESLAEKDRFIASVSHELRTPLTSVVGSLEILADPLVELSADDLADLLSDAMESAIDLERLVEDHLTAARLTAGALTLKLDVVDLDTLVARVVDSINFPPHLAVEVGPLGSCLGDSLRIRQILRNVLRNAARYAQHRIEIGGGSTTDHVVVKLHNDGDPVPDEIADRLFEPFFGVATPGQPQSIGLGLAVSRDLARRMGGDLAYSHDSVMVSFVLSLPVAAETEPSIESGSLRETTT